MPHRQEIAGTVLGTYLDSSEYVANPITLKLNGPLRRLELTVQFYKDSVMEKKFYRLNFKIPGGLVLEGPQIKSLKRHSETCFQLDTKDFVAQVPLTFTGVVFTTAANEVIRERNFQQSYFEVPVGNLFSFAYTFQEKP